MLYEPIRNPIPPHLDPCKMRRPSSPWFDFAPGDATLQLIRTTRLSTSEFARTHPTELTSPANSPGTGLDEPVTRGKDSLRAWSHAHNSWTVRTETGDLNRAGFGTQPSSPASV